MSRLAFHLDGTTKSGLTKIWTVLSNNIELGRVTWFSNWRRYTFSPREGTTFDVECLSEIAVFVGLRTQEHNQ